MAEFLLELFSEEIPARMQAKAATDLKRLVTDRLKQSGFDIDTAQSFVTPRRLTLVIDDLPLAQPDRREERKGPKTDAPQKAINGFLGSVGLTLEQVETREGPKGSFYVATIEEKGRPTTDVISDIVPAVIRDFPWAKSQRWGSGALRWVRPLHSILCLLDGKAIVFDFETINVGNATRGHRFLAPDPIKIASFADYQKKLAKAHVVLDQDERRDKIWSDAQGIADAAGLELKEDKGLLDEVTGLVEWPVTHMGEIDPSFMDLPEEVLMTSMASHQKYFSTLDRKTGKLAPHFIFVSNMETKDNGGKIISGNEGVLRARLADAKFFWDQDRKTKLEQFSGRLDKMVFHARLGTVAAKIERIGKLSKSIAKIVGADENLASEAASIAKADLTTDMVYEFPELQGLMGYYYALEEGRPESVAQAVADHYAPLGPDDQCPSEPVSIAVALADKVDTLTGFWAIDEKPTGSKDPFALRRAALGMIRIILENNVRIHLIELFKQAAAQHSIDGASGKRIVEYGEVADLLAFVADRLKVHMREAGLRHDLIDAVFALGGQDDLVLIVARTEALRQFLDSEDGANLLTLYRRAVNILSKEEKKDKATYSGTPDVALFEQDEERVLYARLSDAVENVRGHVDKENYEAAMASLSVLREPVDAFFDEVTVNAGDTNIRHNRLLILAQIRSTLASVAEFSKVEG